MNTSTIEPATASCTLHLTRILVSYEDAIRSLRIRDAYDWHTKIWKCLEGIIPHNPDKGRFPKGTRRENQPKSLPDFLYRIDKIEGSFRVLILSAKLPRKPDWCLTECYDTQPIPQDFLAYSRYRFSLLANPTWKPVKDKDGNYIADAKKRKRRAITKRDALIAWLQRKAEDGGFTVNSDSLRTIPRGREFFHKNPSSQGTHTAVEFQGELCVTNSAKFRTAVATGIGSAKAFGFGLLVLVPVS